VALCPKKWGGMMREQTRPVNVEVATFWYTLVRSTAEKIMSIDPTSGLFTWIPAAADLGPHSITILALDPCAAGPLPACSAGPATQTFTLEVREPNTPPEFTSDPVLEVMAGELYRYNANATDAESCGAGGPPAGSGSLACDTITFSLVAVPAAPPAAMTIDRRSGMVTWLTTAGDIGLHPITIRASDDRGAFMDQPYTLTVLPDMIAPSVSVQLSATFIEPGDSVTIQVVASDNVSVASRTLEIDGVEFPLDLNHSAIFTATVPGLPLIIATATDPSGNVGQSCDPNASTSQPLNASTLLCFSLRVTDPADTDAPEIAITAPAPGSIVTYLTDILGTITDLNLEFYRLERAPFGTDEFEPFHEVLCPALTPNPCPPTPVLGTFDPTMLPNDDYAIRVTAGDFSGNIASFEFPLSLTANTKLGNFRLEFTDLQVPVVGVPITITRIYDTLEADYSGDFGFGWRLGLHQPRIRETVRVSPLEAAGVPDIFGAFPFRTGTRVYLNNPEGRRVAFTFDPVPEPSFTGTIWRPRFTADPGVFDRLEVDDIVLQQRPDNTFQLFSFFGAASFPYNPREYTLVTKDGVRYRYDQFTGLLDITDRNSNVLTYTDSGIFASSGQSIQFVRDTVGRITSIIDPAGNAMRYEYDAAGDLVSVTDPVNNLTSFRYLAPDASAFRPHYLSEVIDPLGHRAVRNDYDESGRLMANADALGNSATQSYDLADNTEIVSDRLGNETRLRYDDRGNVVSITDPLQATNHFEYDISDNEVAVIDARGLRTGRTFDERGNITGITDPLGNTWRFTYTALNDVRTATDPLGRVVDYRYDSTGNLVELVNAAGSSSFITYDSFGRVIAYTDNNGHTTQYSYGTSALPDVVTNADGSTRMAEHNSFGAPTRLVDENGNETVLAYDPAGRPISVRDAQGNSAVFSYAGHRLASVTDRLGRVRRYEYDAADRRVREIDPLSGVLQFSYDANNHLVAQTDPLGHTTTYLYRPDGRLGSTIDALGGVTSFDYDPAGNQVSFTDANGHTTTSVYDSLNRLVGRTDPLGGTRSIEYDAVGNLVGVIDENGQATRFAYDSLDRLVRRTDPLGGVETIAYDPEGNRLEFTDAAGRTTRYSYDSGDRLIERTDPVGGTVRYGYDGVGNRTSLTDELGHTTVFVYDSLNRYVATIDPVGATTAFSYDAVGNQTLVSDPLGRSTRYEYDALDRLVTITDPLGSTTDFEFDAAGNRTAVTDPLGNTTRFDYDSVNRLVTETNTLGNAKTFSYDAVGNLVETVDRLGRVRHFGYDALDRQTEEAWLDGGLPVRSIQFSYDATGNLLTAADLASSYTLTVDALGRTTSVDNVGTPGAPHTLLGYSYDAVGNVLSVSDNFGVRVDSAYDTADRLLSRSWSGPGVDPVHVEFTYNARGDRIETRRVEDVGCPHPVVRSTFDYDAAGRLSDIVYRDILDAVLADYDYAYDLAGQLLSESHHGQTSSYTHDLAGQLTAADHSAQANESYSYDANGNRLSGSNVVGPNNQILSDGVFDYSYDAEGNLILKTHIATAATTRFEYDHRNRLIAVEDRDSSGSVTERLAFTYDVFDRRIAKTVDADGDGPEPATTSVTVYDGQNPWADFSPAGPGPGTTFVVTSRYLLGAGSDELLARHRPAEGTAWYLTDRLGTVRDLADASGAIADHLDYDSFGVVVLETSPAFGDRFRFTGRELDSETGLYFYRARYYDPRLGRFTSEDPLSFAAGDPNLYRYVGNSPLAFTDPSGQLAISERAVFNTALVVHTYAECFFAGFFINLGIKFLLTPGIEFPVLSGTDFALNSAFCLIPAAVEAYQLYAAASATEVATAAAMETLEATAIEKVAEGLAASDATAGALIAEKTEQLLLEGVGVNVTPLSSIVKYAEIGKNSRTFVTDVATVEKIVGSLNQNTITISSKQAQVLAKTLGIKKLEPTNIISVIDDIASKAPASPIAGNEFFLGGGSGLPLGAPELTIQGVNSSGTTIGAKQIYLLVK